MRTLLLGLIALALSSAACTRGENGQPARAQPRWFAEVPFIARSMVLDSARTSETGHLEMTVRWPIDSVAAFYRRALPEQGWRLVSDASGPAMVSLYLQKGERSLWVQVRRAGPDSSDYALTAATRTPAPAAGPR